MTSIHRLVFLGVIAVAMALPTASVGQAPVQRVSVKRLLDHPIITPDLDTSIGPNIQGPSLIRVPDWVKGRLGKYYLYFADHKGHYIRLAYANNLLGPWKIYVPGSMQLKDSFLLTKPAEGTPEEMAKLRATPQPADYSDDAFTEATQPHIASPDVHVDERNRRIVMYYHGLNGVSQQITRAAVSTDGIHFKARPEILGKSYFHTFDYDGYTYAIAMPGRLYRSKDPLSGFVEGPLLFNPNMRHAALLRRGNTLYVFWTQVGSAPETMLLSTIDLTPDWTKWKASAPVEVYRGTQTWEGADRPAMPSLRSTAFGPVNQLRDPAVFEENGRTYLLYAAAGETGIAIVEVVVNQ